MACHGHSGGVANWGLQCRERKDVRNRCACGPTCPPLRARAPEAARNFSIGLEPPRDGGAQLSP
eukprot:14240084-Alexandrium_andersonii.AAC.1